MELKDIEARTGLKIEAVLTGIEAENSRLDKAVTNALDARDTYRNEKRREYARYLDAAGIGVGYQFLRRVPKRGQTYSRNPETDSKRFVVVGVTHQLRVSVERVSLKNEPMHPGEGFGVVDRDQLQAFPAYTGGEPVKLSTWLTDQWARLIAPESATDKPEDFR